MVIARLMDRWGVRKMDLRASAVWFAVTLGLSTSAIAGVNTWTPIGPAGGEVRKLVYNRDQPATVYMIAEAGFFRSTDEGANWQLTKGDFTNLPSDLDVDPTNQNRVYVASGDVQTLSVSTDGGLTFSPVTSFPNVGNIWQLEVSKDGQTLYAASGARVFRSQDRAATWQERTAIGPSGTPPYSLLIDPTDKETLYAIASSAAASASDLHTLFVTHDGAATWTQITGAEVAGSLYAVAIPESDPTSIWLAGANGVYVSRNSGASFALSFVPNYSQAASVVAVDPSNANNVFVSGFYGRFYKTSDNGANWVEITDNIQSNSAFSIGLQPSQSGLHVLVGGFAGIYLSTVGGTQWSARDKGFLGTRITSLSADATLDRIYISTLNNGVHYLAGGASTTTAVNNSQLMQLGLPATSTPINSVLVQDASAGRLFAAVNSEIGVSSDGGASWSGLGFNSPFRDWLTSLVSSPGNPQVILASGLTSLHRTADGGKNWSKITTGLPANTSVSKVAFSYSDPLVVYAVPAPLSGSTGHYGVYRSTDGGQSWSAANSGIETAAVSALAVDPKDAQTLYASAGSKLWVSTSAGSSWKASNWDSFAWGLPTALAVDSVNPRTIYAASYLTVGRSIDKGETWEVLRDSSARPLGWGETALVDPKRPHTLLLGTYRSGVQQISISPDLALVLDVLSTTGQTVNTPLTFRYTISNLGPYHATGVVLTLQHPVNAQAMTVTASSGACSTSGSTTTCALDVVRTDGSLTVELRATPTATGPFRVDASLSADQPDPKTTNNSLSVSPIMTAAPAPQPPAPQPPTSVGGGGGGALSIYWLLLLASMLPLKRSSRRTGVPRTIV
jgi:photosystem II stability/assembly factor-like uncharacterized protein